MRWKKSKIGNHCEITSSKRIFYSEYVDKGIPFYRSKEIIEKTQGQAISEPLYISEEKYNDIKERFGVPAPGDMLLTSVGTIGIPYVIKTDDYFYFKDGNLTWFRGFDNSLLSSFLCYWIGSKEGFDILNNATIGSSQKALTISALKQIECPLPPISIQQKIVDILSAYDDLIENNRKQIKLLEEAAQRLYKEWFVDLRFPSYETTPIHEGIPDGWMIGELGTIAIDAGKNEKKENANQYSCYLPIDCLPRESLTYTDKNDISLAESSLVGFKQNDILFGAMRPYFHKVVVSRDKGLTRSTCFVVNAKERDYWAYLLMLLFSKDTVDYATKISVGTTMPYVRWKDFIQMPAIIPAKDICAQFQEIIMPIVNRISCLASSIEKLIQSRDRLLPKLMNGEMEVNNGI